MAGAVKMLKKKKKEVEKKKISLLLVLCQVRLNQHFSVRKIFNVFEV
jgi:hypothetical protein